MRNPHPLFATLLLFVASLPASATQQTPVFHCEDNPVSRRTDETTSSQGVRAAVEVQLRVFEHSSGGEPGHRCVAEWTLHVTGPNVPTRKIVFHRYEEREFSEIFGGDSATYFGGAFVNWSADGTTLLAYAQVGGYEDWHLPTPVLYDLTADKSWKVDLDKAFASLPYGRPVKGCELEYRIEGLAADGRIVLHAAPFNWVEDQRCFRPGKWLLDARTTRLERSKEK